MTSSFRLIATSWRTYYTLVAIWAAAWLGGLSTAAGTRIHDALVGVELCLGVALLLPVAFALPRYSQLRPKQQACFRVGATMLVGGTLTGVALTYVFRQLGFDKVTGVNAIGMDFPFWIQAIPLMVTMVSVSIGLVALSWLGWSCLRGEKPPSDSSAAL